MRRSLLLLLALCTSAGCTSTVAVDHEDHELDDPTEVDLGADPWRVRRRMDIDQLDRSIRAVTGGIGWDRGSTPETRVSNFAVYSDTLGVPDFVNSSAEDLSASLLFAKFLDDASRSACRRLVDREAGTSTADGEPQGTFAPIDVSEASPDQADVDEALSSLLLRMHGRRVAVGSPELTPWRELHARIAATAAATETPRRGWEGVCVALLTHPDFYTY